MSTRAERRRLAPGIAMATPSQANSQRVLKLAAVALAAFAVSLAAGAVLPSVFSDARASAVASLSLWAVVPVMLGLMASSERRSWKGWGSATLFAGAGWASASGISAVYIDEIFVGPSVKVFGAVFLVTFLPMVLIVLLAGILLRMKRLAAR